MEVKRVGSQPTANGSRAYFTGMVLVDMLVDREDPARTSSAHVTFSPCARTNWHTHPLGQTLIVTHGCGHVQRWGDGKAVDWLERVTDEQYGATL